MRRTIGVLVFLVSTTIAVAEQSPQADPSKDSQHSTGKTVIPEKQGEMQPQGPTGPINTGSGGAPAESPQGETPAGMQSAPGGSSKTIIDGSKK